MKIFKDGGDKMMRSIEHFKEKIIGQFLSLKKELNEEHNIMMKKIDEYVNDIDRCDNHFEINMIALKSIKDIDGRIQDRKIKEKIK